MLETTASVAASSTSDSSDISSTSLPSSDTPQQSPNTERFLSSPSKFATSAVPKSSTVTPVEITDKSIDMSNQKQGDKICGHRCSLALTEKCCACSDQRPVVDKYEMYVDGEGWKFTDSIRRGDYYCPECRALCIGVQKESWELVQDMRLAGKSIQKVHTAGYGLKDIKKAGYTLDEVTYSNLYEEWELRKSGYTAAELHSAGYTPEQLKTTGYSNDELTELGIDQETLWRLGDVGADY